jgi:CheY-like chemotaxis protein
MLAGVRILVIEDNDDSRELWDLVLSTAGATVTTASGGREALGIAQGQTFDLVVSDLDMPEMDGLTCMRHLRALGDTYARIPTIAVSGHGGYQDRAAVGAAGFDDFVSKPVLPEDLVARIRDLVTTSPLAAR